jgi:hypothetical protein
MAARIAAVALAASLLSTIAASGAGDPGYEWMYGYGDGNASLVYGSPETGEDYVFALICRDKDKATLMTVYVDIAGAKVGQPVAIAFSGAQAKLSVPGTVATDEMSGFLFAEAEGFKIKPVLAVLGEKGPIAVKPGNVVNPLPEAGRGSAAAKFAKSCALD